MPRPFHFIVKRVFHQPTQSADRDFANSALSRVWPEIAIILPRTIPYDNARGFWVGWQRKAVEFATVGKSVGVANRRGRLKLLVV